MFKTTTSAIAITALLTLGAYAQSSDTATDATDATTVEGAADATMEKAGETMEAAGDAAENAASEAGEAIEQTGDAAAEAADATMENAGEAMEATGDAAADAASDAAATVEGAADATMETVEDAAAEGEAAVEGATETVTETVPVTTPAEGETMEAEATEGAEPAEGTPVQGQIFEQSADSFLASTLLGASVQSPDGESIGEVEDMILGSDGSVEGVVVGVGGFLGIGEKDVALEFGSIQIQQDAETGRLTFVSSSTEEQLEAAPEFKDADDQRAEKAAMEAEAAAAAQQQNGGLVTPADPNAAPATE